MVDGPIFPVLRLLVIRIAVGNGGEVVSHPLLLQDFDIARRQSHTLPDKEINLKLRSQAYNIHLLPYAGLVIGSEKEQFLEWSVRRCIQELGFTSRRLGND